MQVEPDAQAAREDEHGVLRLVRAGLSRVLPQAVLPPDHEIAYPGYHAAAHRAQRLARSGTPSPEQLDVLYAELRAVNVRARASAARRTQGGHWSVDLPPAEGHLTESLDRARACIPPRPDRSADLAALTVSPWGPRHRLAFDEAVGVLGRVWPQMLAEVSTVVRQVALLEGWGIDGFTDFTVHGVIFVNSARVAPDGPRDGGGELPAPLPLVEALVHEGTHNRCDAAAVTAPFLADTPTQLLRTPLRADPRPLTGLFQQVVVLARSVLLYERLLSGPHDTVNGARAAVEARRDLLLAQGLDGCTTLDEQRGALAEHGRSVADQARQVLERAAR